MSVPLMKPVTLSSVSGFVKREDNVPAISTWISVKAKMFVVTKHIIAVNSNLKRPLWENVFFILVLVDVFILIFLCSFFAILNNAKAGVCELWLLL